MASCALSIQKLTANHTARLCEHFVAGTPARTAAEMVGISKNSAALFYHRLREIIAAQIEDESPIKSEIEVDESYFGGHRKGKRGRGAAGKVAVFGILKRGGRVYTKMILDSRRTTLIPIITAKVEPDSVVFSDSVPASDVLDISGFRHHRINHPEGIRRRTWKPHQWHREVLEPGQAPPPPIQRNSPPPLPPVPQEMRVALQLRKSDPALVHPQDMEQTLNLLGQPLSIHDPWHREREGFREEVEVYGGLDCLHSAPG